MSELYFLKLGGSLITNKTGTEEIRVEVLARLAAEISEARLQNPHLQLLIGHGGGSFGHVVAAKHGTRQGVASPAEWYGFAEVHAAMSWLNQLVIEALLAVDVPAVSFPPVALGRCENGRLSRLASENVAAALSAGLVPVVHGDVIFDDRIGGTIVSTEEVMALLVAALRPSRLLLAGEVTGVLATDGQLIPTITTDNFHMITDALGASRGTDVTGGMVSKVTEMITLTTSHPDLVVHIFSGLENGRLYTALTNPSQIIGTQIRKTAE